MRTIETLSVPANADVVEFAAQCTIPFEFRPHELTAMEMERASLSRFSQSLSRLEDPTDINARLAHLGPIVEKMKAQKRVLAFDPTCQILDPVVFGFRHENGMPQLMPFLTTVPRSGFVCQSAIRIDVLPEIMRRMQDMQCQFGYDGGLTSLEALATVVKCRMFPEIPAVTRLYDDVHRVIQTRVNKKAREDDDREGKIGLRTYRISTQFGGLIPLDVKQKIERARNTGIFRNLFILAAVTQWQEDFTTATFSNEGDPLVIGWDGYQFWLVDKFDTTSLEQIVVDEFCTRPV